MHDASAHEARNVLDAQSGVLRDLTAKHLQPSRSVFWRISIILGILVIVGIVGFVMRLQDGVGNGSVWGYHAALFAFILATAGGAPMVAIAPRIAKAHWRRSISRVSELFALVSLFNILVFIPLIWVLPSMEDGRRTLWFFGKLDVPSNMPHIILSE